MIPPSPEKQGTQPVMVQFSIPNVQHVMPDDELQGKSGALHETPELDPLPEPLLDPLLDVLPELPLELPSLPASGGNGSRSPSPMI